METAVDLGLRVMSLKPSAMTAYVTAVGLTRLGRHSEAEELLNQALVFEPDNVDLLAELAVVLEDQDKHAEATATLAGSLRAGCPGRNRRCAVRAWELCGSLHTFEELRTAHPDYLSRPWVRLYYDRARSRSISE